MEEWAAEEFNSWCAQEKSQRNLTKPPSSKGDYGHTQGCILEEKHQNLHEVDGNRLLYNNSTSRYKLKKKKVSNKPLGEWKPVPRIAILAKIPSFQQKKIIRHTKNQESMTNALRPEGMQKQATETTYQSDHILHLTDKYFKVVITNMFNKVRKP